MLLRAGRPAAADQKITPRMTSAANIAPSTETIPSSRKALDLPQLFHQLWWYWPGFSSLTASECYASARRVQTPKSEIFHSSLIRNRWKVVDWAPFSPGELTLASTTA